MGSEGLGLMMEDEDGRLDGETLVSPSPLLSTGDTPIVALAVAGTVYTTQPRTPLFFMWDLGTAGGNAAGRWAAARGELREAARTAAVRKKAAPEGAAQQERFSDSRAA
jgi:hypothetical protein